MTWAWRVFGAVLLSVVAAGCTNVVHERDGGDLPAGCTVSGQLVEAGAFNSGNSCAVCDPARSSTDWSARPDGTPCDAGVCEAGACAAKCFIDGALRTSGALNSINPCQRCEPTRSTSAWSQLATGANCGAGQVCEGGACTSKCFIDGQLRVADALNVDNGCQRCDPAQSTEAWSAVANGTSCGSGGVCESGACSAQCFISGSFYAASAANPANGCEQCTPSTSTSTWSPRATGASCGTGQICEASACVAKCFIAGAVVAADAVNPANECEQCSLAVSTTSWSPRAEGTSCSGGRVCSAANCALKCFIAGVVYAADEVNPANRCQQCVPATAVGAWSTRSDGASCELGKVCMTGTCEAKCLIAGVFVDAGVVNPATVCEQCSPPVSTTMWTSRGALLLLDGGTEVASQGWSVTAQAPSAVSYLPDSVRLQTSTNSGAVSGGQLLLVKAGAVEAGQPFTLQVEAMVEAVNAHNQFDSAAAILGSFTAPAGTAAQRSEMIYLDAAAVGWADNSQSASVAVQDGAFHTYQLSVDAAGTANLSVDGVLKLTRTGFTTTGTIAIGDQTNDPNVDATLRIRKVTRVCQ